MEDQRRREQLNVIYFILNVNHLLYLLHFLARPPSYSKCTHIICSHSHVKAKVFIFNRTGDTNGRKIIIG
jgi:hypothetical protein